MDDHETHHEIAYQFDHETRQYLPETGGRHAVLTVVFVIFVVIFFANFFAVFTVVVITVVGVV